MPCHFFFTFLFFSSSFPALQALLPIANIPAIEWTLQFLAAQEGLTEIILFSAKHVTELRSYLSNSRWRANVVPHSSKSDADDAGGETATTTSAPKAPATVAVPRIRVVTSIGVHSAGDALRAVDAMGVVRSETFLLLDGPAFLGNASLSQAIAGHNGRNKQDTNAIMTLVAKRAHNTSLAATSGGVSCGVGSRGSLGSLTRLALSPSDGKLHGYDRLSSSEALSNPTTLSSVTTKVLKTDPAAVATVDILDTRVYCCSLTVLVHFSDNYDYQSLRDAYLKNETLNIDMGFRFNAHLLAADAFLAPVTDLSSYSSLTTRDVVKGGWCFPLIPSNNWAEDVALAACGDASVAHLSNGWTAHSSKAPTVLLQKGSSVDPKATFASRDVVVAAGASIAAGAQIGSGVVIGPNAKIGEGAVIGSNTVVLAGAVVGKGATVLGSSIIGAKASIGEGATVGEGAVLGSGVVVAAAQKVAAHARLTAVPEDGGSDKKTREWPSRDEYEEEGGDDDDEDSDDDSSDDEAAKKKAAAAKNGANDGASFAASLFSTASSELAAVDKAQAAYKASLRDYYHSQSQAGADMAKAELSLASSLVSLVEATQQALKNRLLASSPANASLVDALTVSLAAARAGAAFSGVPLTLAKAKEMVKKSKDAGSGAKAQPASSSSASTSAASSLTPTERFNAGVADIISSRPVSSAEDVRHVTMEIKSFKYAENKTFADCVKAALPVVLEHGVPAASKPENGASTVAYITSLRKALTLWTPLVQAFVNGFNDELAVVEALESFVLDAKRATHYKPLFGFLLNALYEADCATDIAVTAWASTAEDDDEEDEESEEEEGGKKPAKAAAGAGAGSAASVAAAAKAKAKADRKELVNQKMTQKLLEALDEEEDEEEEDEDEEDDE